MNMSKSDNESKIPEIIDVENELNEELVQYFKGQKDGFVRVGPKNWFYPKKYRKLAGEYMDFEVRPDDVWITGYPRSGTTVTQELAWLLCNNLDFEGAKRNIHERVRVFESSVMHNEKMMKERLETHPEERKITLERIKRVEITLKLLDAEKGRRVIKTHLPFELLPPDIFNKGCKVIYLCRNPKDVAVSFCCLQSKVWNTNYVGNFDTYWKFFVQGNCMFGPYFKHVKQGIEKKELKNFHFVFYEELRKNLKNFIIRMTEFLQIPLKVDELKKLEHHLDFDNFKNNPAIGIKTEGKNIENVDFVRKGQIGEWREHFTKEMEAEANRWIEKHTQEIGFVYPE